MLPAAPSLASISVTRRPAAPIICHQLIHLRIRLLDCTGIFLLPVWPARAAGNTPLGQLHIRLIGIIADVAPIRT